VVSFDSRPALIPNNEISSLRQAVESRLPLGPWPFLNVGHRVRIEKGLLAWMEGILEGEATAWRVIVSINALQKSVAIEVARDMIVPEHPNGRTAWLSTSLETNS